MDEQGTHSTAELAKLINAPVLLIIDCAKSTRTVAAMALGCRSLDPDVQIGGVILNMIGTARHERLVRRAVEEYTGIPVLGAVPRVRDNSLPERHMGLVPPQEHPEADSSIESAGRLISQSLDLDRIWDLARSAGPVTTGRIAPSQKASVTSLDSLRVGVIRDSSFWFYYPENLEDLARLGATIVEIDSLRDSVLPSVDALYIGGGFPETHAAALADNAGFRESLGQAIENGLPVYAECGGLMYLGKSLLVNGAEYPMVGAFPVSFTVEKRPQGHGYTVLKVDRDNPYFSQGAVIRGHEFHYSKPLAAEAENLETAFKSERGAGFFGKRDGLVKKNTLATYSHIHSSGEDGWAKALINQARSFNIFRRCPCQTVDFHERPGHTPSSLSGMDNPVKPLFTAAPYSLKCH